LESHVDESPGWQYYQLGSKGRGVQELEESLEKDEIEGGR
jgi:hypothetical protein